MESKDERKRVKRELARAMRADMNETEALLWPHLRANRLSGLHFRAQQPLFGFIADFYCHAAKLDVEVDGGIHEHQAEYDAERDALLSARGIRVLRIPAERIVQDIKSVLQEIGQVAREQMNCPHKE